MEKTDKPTAGQVSESEGLQDWRVLLRSLQSSFQTGSMAKGVEFATRIGAAADEANHHPDLTSPTPASTSCSPPTTPTASPTRDVDLARTISAIAGELGITAEPPS